MDNEFYYPYSKYLKDKYGEKVYKLPIKLNLTCPNRDGNVAYGGCIFCSETGGSFENLSKEMPVREQLEENKNYISSRYGAKKFIAYFQNFTNTYMDIDRFKKVVNEAIIDDVVAISISTRPDCIYDEQLEFLYEIKGRYNIDIVFELGLQTVNYHSLEKLNRAHGLSDFLLASKKIKKYGFEICVHMIVGLPWDDELDIIEGAKIISIMEVDEVKIHSLYIPKNTKLEKMYLNKDIETISLEKYIEYVIIFLRYLNPNIAIQRLVGRMPEEESVFCNWSTSWWKIRDMIHEKMIDENIRQGDRYNYNNGLRML